MNYLLSKWYLMVMQKSHLVETDQKFHQYAETGQLDLVIMGNSHTFAINADSIQNSIHFGSYAETIEKSFFKLKYLVESDKEPQRIILSYDLGLLNDKNINLKWNSFYWVKYYDKMEFFEVTDDKLGFVFHLLKAKLIPYADGEIDLVDYYFSDEVPVELENLRNDKKALNQVKAEFDCLDSQLSDIGVHYFKKFVNTCTENGIELILVRFPLTSYFYQSQLYCYDDLEYYDWIKSNCLSDEIRILDYHNSYADSLFKDPHHLKGGVIRQMFTSKLKNDIAQN